jgi:hypothetical protein
MLNGKISGSVGNTSSEDSLCKFTVVPHIEYEWELFQGHRDCLNSFAEFFNVTFMADSPICKQDASGEEGKEGENTVVSSVTRS